MVKWSIVMLNGEEKNSIFTTSKTSVKTNTVESLIVISGRRKSVHN